MKSLFSSISNAIQGIMYVFKREKNFKIQLCIALVVICISLFFQISRVEWLFILSLIFLVLSLELLNSAFEKITDILKPRLHEQIKVVKDISAGMVFIFSIGSCCIGGYIFYPYVIELFLK
jgi:diacylglycerol kinase